MIITVIELFYIALLYITYAIVNKYLHGIYKKIVNGNPLKIFLKKIIETILNSDADDTQNNTTEVKCNKRKTTTEQSNNKSKKHLHNDIIPNIQKSMDDPYINRKNNDYDRYAKLYNVFKMHEKICKLEKNNSKISERDNMCNNKFLDNKLAPLKHNLDVVDHRLTTLENMTNICVDKCIDSLDDKCDISNNGITGVCVTKNSLMFSHSLSLMIAFMLCLLLS